jgi:hypothetical protein
MDAPFLGAKGPAVILTARKFQRALALLFEGSVYAEQSSGDPWDFAVEAEELRRLKLSNNDLRYLVHSKYLESSDETHSVARGISHHPKTARLRFSKDTCFVLTPEGIDAFLGRSRKPFGKLHRKFSVVRMPHASRSGRRNFVPCWDIEHRVLTFNGTIVKQFRRHAVNQELVLAAFQEEDWPLRILDPLAPLPSQDSKRRLSDTIKWLNRGQTSELVHFRGDGTGEGVTWERAM